jgi:ribosomal protein L40E
VITCTRCGFENDNSAVFCRSCGGYLEWSGQRAEPDPPEEHEPEVAPAPPVEAAAVGSPGLVRRVRERMGGPSAVGGEGLAHGEDGGPSSSRGLAEEANGAAELRVAPEFTDGSPTTADAETDGAAAEAGAPPSTDAAAPDEAEEALLAAGDEPTGRTPGARPPSAVLPQTVAPRPKVKPVAPADDVREGDLICGQCGAGNVSTRRFCRRCGSFLEDAVVYHQSRWQRFLQRRRRRKIHPAGSRPGSGGHGRLRAPGWLTSWVTKVLSAAVVLFALAATVGPFHNTIQSHISRWSGDVGRFLHPTYTPVHPITATATSQTLGHGASLAIDGATNTCWQTSSGNNGVGQSLTITFAKPVNIARVGILSGDQDTGQSYLTLARPQLVHLVFNGSPSSSQDITVADQSSFQTFGVSSHHATSMTLTIVSSYQSPVGHNAAIAEVEFYTKDL